VGAAVLLAPVLLFSGLYFTTPRGNFARHGKQKEPTTWTPKEVTVAAPAPAAKSPETPLVTGVSRLGQRAEQTPHCAPANSTLAIVNREDVGVYANPGKIPVEGWDGGPLKIDPRFEFQILEKSDEWVRIRIKAPIWPPDRTERMGWIEAKFMQRVENADEMKCLFVDVEQWTSLAGDIRNAMHDVALRILADDHRCARISNGGYLGQGQRYFFSCYPIDGGRAYHYWFDAGDAVSNRSFAEPSPLNPKTALARCRQSLYKVVAQLAKMSGSGSYDLQVMSTSASMLDGAHHVTFTFRSRRQNPRPVIAYCLAPPGGEPEITLPKDIFNSDAANSFEVN
jgi:hypothetical protein